MTSSSIQENQKAAHSFLEEAYSLLKTVFTKAKEDNVSLLAAAIAFNAALSLAPLIIVALGVVGLLFGKVDARQQIVAQVAGLAGQRTANAFERLATAAVQFDVGSGGVLAAAIGLGGLLFGTTGVFARIQQALDLVWEVEFQPDNSIVRFIKDRGLALILVLGFGLLIILSMILNASLSIMHSQLPDLIPATLLIRAANTIILILTVAVYFAAIYRFLPRAEIAWRDVWVGTAVTAALFVAGGIVISLYLSSTGITSAYGAASSLLIILLWVYYSAQIFLLGAVFTQIYANRYGSKIKPIQGNAIESE